MWITLKLTNLIWLTIVGGRIFQNRGLFQASAFFNPFSCLFSHFFCAHPNFRTAKKRKMLRTYANPRPTEMLATQARVSIVSTSMSQAPFSLSRSPKSTLQTSVQVLAFFRVHDWLHSSWENPAYSLRRIAVSIVGFLISWVIQQSSLVM